MESMESKESAIEPGMLPRENSKEEQLYWAIDEFSKLSKTHGNRKYGLEVFERLMEMDGFRRLGVWGQI